MRTAGSIFLWVLTAITGVFALLFILAFIASGTEDVTGAGWAFFLLTPSADDAHGALMYDARYNSVGGTVTIHVCNFSSATINDGITHFNVLTFDAQQ